MKDVPLKTRVVGDLVSSGDRFVVPFYQRGYRWEEEQVNALLDDLWEFENSVNPPPFYCLQAIIVVKKSGEAGEEGEWEVVDGQQRLTTIFLILHHLKPEKKLFSVRYERRPESKTGLLGMLDGPPSNVDSHYLSKAQETIKKWFGDGNDKQKDEFLELLLKNADDKCAKFIWHEIKDGKGVIDAFRRNNSGKIRLLDAELIRALFLQSDPLGNYKENERHRIALRWDQMEQRLQHPEFWNFISKDSDVEGSRIGFLFRCRAIGEKSSGKCDRKVFEGVYNELKRGTTRVAIWQEVEDLFDTLEEWYEDNRLFHLVGFLVELGIPLTELIGEPKDQNDQRKREFRLQLKGKILQKLIEDATCEQDIEDHLKKVEYPDSGIKNLLLCANLATLVSDQGGTVRFSFHQYRKEKGWDIEHIRASASRPPEGKNELLEALNAIRGYWNDRSDPDNNEIRELLGEIDGDLDDAEEAWMAEKFQKLCDRMENPGEKELGECDGIGNLTLLDAGTNRGIRNGPFQVKRPSVLEIDRQGKYLLPCTRNVFTKSYSKAPLNLLHWTGQDAGDYQSVMVGLLVNFFEETWNHPS